MRTYVSTIGHHSTRVMRPILNEGIDESDRVVLLRPADDMSEQGADAVEDVRKTVRELGPDATVDVAEVTYECFETAVVDCIDVLDAAHGTIIVNFDGGPREVFLPLAIATIARHERVDRTLQFRDIDKKVHELVLPDLMTRIPETTEDTLREIDDLASETTLPDLTEETGKARSTIGRHLDILEAADAVKTYKEDKIRCVELTLGGRLRIR